MARKVLGLSKKALKGLVVLAVLAFAAYYGLRVLARVAREGFQGPTPPATPPATPPPAGGNTKDYYINLVGTTMIPIPAADYAGKTITDATVQVWAPATSLGGSGYVNQRFTSGNQKLINRVAAGSAPRIETVLAQPSTFTIRGSEYPADKIAATDIKLPLTGSDARAAQGLVFAGLSPAAFNITKPNMKDTANNNAHIKLTLTFA